MAKKADSSNNGALTQAVLAVVLQVPDSTERMGEHPAERAHAIARSAARAASVLSGSLSLPPGIFAWLTIVPELVGVWKLQAQMPPAMPIKPVITPISLLKRCGTN